MTLRTERIDVVRTGAVRTNKPVRATSCGIALPESL